jgi:high affinity Mn2+ porin
MPGPWTAARLHALARSLSLAVALGALPSGSLCAQQPLPPMAAWAPSGPWPLAAAGAATFAPWPAFPVTAQAPMGGGNGATSPAPTQPPAGNGAKGAESASKADSKNDDKKDEKSDEKKEQNYNLHADTTVVAQGDPGFPAQYSGPNSLNSAGERQETLSAELFGGVRLWCGAEMHADLLMWQGFGLSQTFGVEAFPSADAYKAGTSIPDFMVARLFIRQTFGLGGEQEDVKDDQLTLAGKQDISRVTITIGRFTPTDLFDNNTYAHDPHTQFLNWAGSANLTWDYPADSVGYTTGLAVELNQPEWAVRYGWFQMPGVDNGFTADDRIFCWPGAGSSGEFFRSWGMMTEIERRWKINGHPGAIRFMPWVDEADFASFDVATALLRANPPPTDAPQGSESTIPAAAFAYRLKYGFCVNWEQELVKNVGLFSRLGWNDGHEAAWTYTDANWSASAGASIKGAAWCRPDDTVGILGVVSGASRDQQEFLEAGGTGILNGDGALNYSPEKVLETYYSFPIGKTAHFTFDYQFVADPAFNSARGPVSIFAIRLHWED